MKEWQVFLPNTSGLSNTWKKNNGGDERQITWGKECLSAVYAANEKLTDGSITTAYGLYAELAESRKAIGKKLGHNPDYGKFRNIITEIKNTKMRVTSTCARTAIPQKPTSSQEHNGLSDQFEMAKKEFFGLIKGHQPHSQTKRTTFIGKKSYYEYSFDAQLDAHIITFYILANDSKTNETIKIKLSKIYFYENAEDRNKDFISILHMPEANINILFEQEIEKDFKRRSRMEGWFPKRI